MIGLNKFDSLINSSFGGERTFNYDPFSQVESLDYSDLVEGNVDDLVKHPELALSTSHSVYSCISIRAKLLGGLPIELIKVDSRKKGTVVSSHPLIKLLEYVNPFWTTNRLIQATEFSLCIWGEAYWYLVKSRGVPKEIWWVSSKNMKVLKDERKYIKGYEYTYGNGRRKVLKPDEVIHFSRMNISDEFSGLAELQSVTKFASYERDAIAANAELHQRGNQLTGLGMPKGDKVLTSEQARELSNHLDGLFRGSTKKSNRWGVLKMEAEIVPLSVSPRDAEFINGMQISLESVARAFGVPLDLLGGQRSYQNIATSTQMIYNFTVIPEAKFLADELKEQMLPLYPRMYGNHHIRFNTDGILSLQDQKADLWMRQQRQIELGVITINEWRAKNNLDPVPWGDEPPNGRVTELKPVPKGDTTTFTPVPNASDKGNGRVYINEFKNILEVLNR